MKKRIVGKMRQKRSDIENTRNAHGVFEKTKLIQYKKNYIHDNDADSNRKLLNIETKIHGSLFLKPHDIESKNLIRQIRGKKNP